MQKWNFQHFLAINTCILAVQNSLRIAQLTCLFKTSIALTGAVFSCFEFERYAGCYIKVAFMFSITLYQYNHHPLNQFLFSITSIYLENKKSVQSCRGLNSWTTDFINLTPHIINAHLLYWYREFKVQKKTYWYSSVQYIILQVPKCKMQQRTVSLFEAN